MELGHFNRERVGRWGGLLLRRNNIMLIENTNVTLQCSICNQKRHLGYPMAMNLAALKIKMQDHICSNCQRSLELVTAKFKIGGQNTWGQRV